MMGMGVLHVLIIYEISSINLLLETTTFLEIQNKQSKTVVPKQKEYFATGRMNKADLKKTLLKGQGVVLLLCLL
jgi:hypothetical protein